MKRARQGADRGGQRRAAIGTGRGDDPGREGRRVQPVLGGADPVRVDRLRVPRIGLPAPAQEEPLAAVLPAATTSGSTAVVRRRRSAPTARRWTSSARRAGRDPAAPARRRSRSASRASTRPRAWRSPPAGRPGRYRSAPAARTPPARALRSRCRRRRAAPRHARTDSVRRAPRCPHRGSGASHLRGRARRSPSPRRPRRRAQA